jgi:hypothetical protein
VLAVNPETEIGEVAEVPVIEPGVEVAVKVVTVPPVTAAVNGTDAVVPETVAVPIVGASGTSGIGVIPGISVLLDTLLRIVT